MELENAQESIESALSQRAAAEADAKNARTAAGREIFALTTRVEDLAAHLEAACTENASLSARLEELAVDNTSLQVSPCHQFILVTMLSIVLKSCTQMLLRSVVRASVAVIV